MDERADIVICGAGITGIATAHALSTHHGRNGILMLDPLPPLSLTSAASGENYRNWWPQARLAEFAARSIDLVELLAGPKCENFRIARRGYAYVTRSKNVDGVINHLYETYGNIGAGDIRVHEKGSAPPDARDGADVLVHRDAIEARYPHLSGDIGSVILVRRAGEFDTQQLGLHMLKEAKERGVRLMRAELRCVAANRDGFRLEAETPEGMLTIETGTFINAAGPFAKNIASMLDVDLPLDCIYQQKIAFEDHLGVVPRDAPFTIDQDAGLLDWPDDARALLAEDPGTAWLTQVQPGGVHMRPESGENSRWIKLGWATNDMPEEPVRERSGNDHFPEIVMRGAARMAPGLTAYCEALPRALTHYGGYYTRTAENWPLIGPMGPDRAFMVAGLSGYGTMMACAAGELCAAWVTGAELPDYARDFSLLRYQDVSLMQAFERAYDDGEL